MTSPPEVSSRDSWSDADAYEAFMGRWSRHLAEAALHSLAVSPGQRWVDVGCGTGALTEAILRLADPARIDAIDPTRAYLEEARRRTDDSRATFHSGQAESLPVEDGVADVAISGLAVNFVPQPERAVREMQRVLRRGGLLAAYVWDYAEGMEMLRQFWDAAVVLHPEAAALDEGRRFPLCRVSALRALFAGARLEDVQVEALTVPMRFRDFDDYWAPFLGGQGPAPSFVAALPPEQREALRDQIRDRLPPRGDDGFVLRARAWIARGRSA